MEIWNQNTSNGKLLWFLQQGDGKENKVIWLLRHRRAFFSHTLLLNLKEEQTEYENENMASGSNFLE